MDVRIGMLQSARELAFESDAKAGEVIAQLQAARANNERFVTFTDVKGNEYLVNTEAIAYVECGADAARRVGFVS